jgi:hypothetical protein
MNISNTHKIIVKIINSTLFTPIVIITGIILTITFFTLFYHTSLLTQKNNDSTTPNNSREILLTVEPMHKIVYWTQNTPETTIYSDDRGDAILKINCTQTCQISYKTQRLDGRWSDVIMISR